MGFPLLDFTKLLSVTTADGKRDLSSQRVRRGNGSALEPVWSEACQASPDGVHVSEWVDHVRARLLLGYLCAGGGFLKEPLTARPFSRHAAGCAHGGERGAGGRGS